MKNKEIIYEEIITSKKYSKIKPDVIKKIIEEEYPKYKNNKLCIKSIKNKLHQIHEIFLNCNSNDIAKKLLKEQKYDDILSLHISTLERKPLYNEFYNRIFATTGIPKSILDLACGYNPFSIKYMNLNKDFEYYAYDINEETNELLNDFFKSNNYQGIAKTFDLAEAVPQEKTDIALVLKFLPLIEQQNKGFTLKFLKSIKSKYLVVSFPTKTVSGKVVGMIPNYTNNFLDLIKTDFKIIDKILFTNELVFIIEEN